MNCLMKELKLKNLNFSFIHPDSSIIVNIDQFRFEQAIINLLDNANKIY